LDLGSHDTIITIKDINVCFLKSVTNCFWKSVFNEKQTGLSANHEATKKLFIAIDVETSLQTMGENNRTNVLYAAVTGCDAISELGLEDHGALKSPLALKSGIYVHTEEWRRHLEQKMVLQSDAIEEPFLVQQRTFKTRGSLKNHVLREFFKEPIKVSQRTFKPGFFKEQFP